jgi:hypothetical protein
MKNNPNYNPQQPKIWANVEQEKQYVTELLAAKRFIPNSNDSRACQEMLAEYASKYNTVYQ